MVQSGEHLVYEGDHLDDDGAVVTLVEIQRRANGKAFDTPGDAEPREGLRVEFQLTGQNVKRFIRIDP